MGFTKDQLLVRFQELQIDYSKYEHPIVLTVEAQAKYVGNLGGGLSKNLFLKDKKNRFYIVSALADTKVDLKVLSARLGLGKGGLRMAPEEALGEILQVPLGCVTPFALVNESARHVSLLLDQGFKSQEHCFFHPLSNDVSISLNVSGLDMFLKSIGRDSSYVDLEANPSIGKDQPPDLASLVPSDSTVLPDVPVSATSSKGPSEKHTSADIKSTKTSDKASKPSLNAQNANDKLVKGVNPSGSITNVERFVEEILDKASALLLSEITEESIKLHGGQLGTVVSNRIKSRLSSELNSTSMTFKNAAFTEGFHAGIHCHPKRTY
ncbi:YbaK/aminoacyl-tRNA synthetase-associated domain containing protein [Parasponia andersonii]|uniref:YbaK/aminoacyl-tRNA synthetase-associated domain containing protein n=1 Tax=Parasponia andersonii TaxID=3476 RepID=A0A2P5CFL0_PARAD|nr:YbaK/aminoacyl-tRNA synthetase-associated domain containing protein [Parasponia andersonii]